MMEQCEEKLNIAMFGQKRIPSREGGVSKGVQDYFEKIYGRYKRADEGITL